MALAITSLGMTSLSASAQSEMSAVRIAQQTTDEGGSARFQALAGSMGAIGADFSSVMRNPAGIAFFRSNNRLSFTGSYLLDNNNSKWYGESHSNGQNRLLFQDFSYLTSWQQSVGVNFSMGFGIRRAAGFSRDLDANARIGLGRGATSMADYAAAILNNWQHNTGNTLAATDLEQGMSVFSEGYPWLGALAYNAGWLETTTPTNRFQSRFSYPVNDPKAMVEAPQNASLRMIEKGSVMHYDLNFAMGLASRLKAGLLLRFTSLDYRLDSHYSESYEDGVDPLRNGEGLSLRNTYRLSGTGMALGLGLIAEPTDNLRLGLAYYSPTFYTMREDFAGDATSLRTGQGSGYNTPTDAGGKFAQLNPWRLTASIGYIIGHRGFLNFDYEYTTLSGTRLAENSNWDYNYDYYSADNDAIKADFGGKQTFRLGSEYNVTSRFALRAGVAYTLTSLSNELSGKLPEIEVYTSGTQPHYTLPRGEYTLALGLGYKFTPALSLDLSVSNKTIKSDTYAFPLIEDHGTVMTDPSKKPEGLDGLEAITHKQNRTNIAISLNYRF